MTHRRIQHALALTAIVVAVGHGFSPATIDAQRVKFFSDDPLQREPETQDASKVAVMEIGLSSDLLLNLFTQIGDPRTDVKAQNINTIDEVPDSSWFTNRIYARSLTADEITRGPNEGPAPAAG